MSFFVSDSLKGIITEKDLEADSPIKIIEEQESIKINFENDNIKEFKCELISINFCEDHDKIFVSTNQTTLSYIFKCVNKKVNYSISLNSDKYLENSGTLLINKLEVNNEDNCVMCKIDIIKRSN